MKKHTKKRNKTKVRALQRLKTFKSSTGTITHKAINKKKKKNPIRLKKNKKTEQQSRTRTKPYFI